MNKNKVNVNDFNAIVKLTDSSPFTYNEAYNHLRTNIMFSLAAMENKKKTVVVSSAMAGDCKSSVSSNLAISLARLQQRVLIIDADLRKPRLHRIFGVSNKIGLTNMLLDPNIKNAVMHLDDCNLDFLSAGTIPPNPSELLSSKAMSQLVDTFENEYDYIIIDTSPILLVSDALTLSKIAAGMLISCKCNKTTYKEVNSVLESLRLADFPILGTVLVGSKTVKGLYSHHGHYYYSAYRTQQSDDAGSPKTNGGKA